MYCTRYFSIEELVPPELMTRANRATRADKLFMLFDRTALQTLDRLRERYGPLVVNDWRWGGRFRYSGWRPWDCAEGAPFSQHKMGRAFDCKFADCTADEVRDDIRRNPQRSEFAFIRRVEAMPDMSWFHFDTGNTHLPYRQEQKESAAANTPDVHNANLDNAAEFNVDTRVQPETIRLDNECVGVTNCTQARRCAGHILFIGAA